MEMGMQEPGEMCRCLANAHIPAALSLGLIGVVGMHANRIIMTIRSCTGSA